MDAEVKAKTEKEEVDHAVRLQMEADNEAELAQKEAEKADQQKKDADIVAET